MIKDNKINASYFWFNRPNFQIENNRLHIFTSPYTDFWQKTHYNFERDNGHCLLTSVNCDFSITVRTEYFPKNQYDQCGLIIRNDSENWIKVSLEYENEIHSGLGSVVTNLGYSDWAMINIISKINLMWYRIHSNKGDFLIEFSEDGIAWKQHRISHLYSYFNELTVGIYACSPMECSFEAIFDNLILENSNR
jgi:uncharacterized protein